MVDVVRLAAELRQRASGKDRFMVAIAGCPGSGKSTLAAEVTKELHKLGETAVVVPMDGYHFDDIILNARGDRPRKGAAHTFDAGGFEVLLKRIRASEPEIAIPVFDRSLELSRAAADIVNHNTRFIIVEGLYLLLNREPWRRLKQLFDYTIFLDVPLDTIVERLTKRILSHGFDAEYARNWIASNDMLNVRDVLDNSAEPDARLENS
jgi:pantothenate kinase